MNSLLPCPFCGGTNIYIDDSGVGSWYVQCEDCGVIFPHFDTEEEAIYYWNRRAHKPVEKIQYELFEKAEELTNALKKLTIKPTK